jgi:AcrR family transcriptional regulator
MTRMSLSPASSRPHSANPHSARPHGTHQHSANPYASALDLPIVPDSPTREAIEHALGQIEHETGHDARDISVTELCRRAHVARSTFYANYHHTDEAQRGLELRLLHRIIDGGDPLRSTGTQAASEAFTHVIDLVAENTPLFRLFLVEVPNRRFIHDWKQALCAHLWDRLFVDRSHGRHLPSSVNRQLIVELVAGLMVSFVTFWLEHPGEVSMEEIHAQLPHLIALIDEVW